MARRDLVTGGLRLANAVLWTFEQEEAMIRLTAIAFALALASSAQAMPQAPLQQSDDMVITVREACGAGMHRVGGVCVSNVGGRHARRAVRRCATGVTC
jgi:hypothetical protein